MFPKRDWGAFNREVGVFLSLKIEVFEKCWWILGKQTTHLLSLAGPQPPPPFSSPQEAKSGTIWLSTGATDCSPQPRGPLVRSGLTLLTVNPKFNYKQIRNVQCRSIPPRLPPTSTSACVLA